MKLEYAAQNRIVPSDDIIRDMALQSTTTSTTTPSDPFSSMREAGIGSSAPFLDRMAGLAGLNEDFDSMRLNLNVNPFGGGADDESWDALEPIKPK